VLDAVTGRRRAEIRAVLGAMELSDARGAVAVMQAFAEAAHEPDVGAATVAAP
jgi:hypothetical protein